jgi:hypothetical protein
MAIASINFSMVLALVGITGDIQQLILLSQCL